MFSVVEEALQSKGISIYQLAKATGINPSTLYEWRKGRYKPKADKLILICQYLDIDLTKLL